MVMAEPMHFNVGFGHIRKMQVNSSIVLLMDGLNIQIILT